MDDLYDIDIVKIMMVRDPSSPFRTKALRNSQSVASIARDFLSGQDRESFIAINLDYSNKITNIHVVSIGTVAGTIVEPREVFKTAILSNASSIIIAHNHPSGNPEPSDDDIKITRILFECGRVMRIKILDHIVLGDDKYTSVRLEGGEICLETKNFEDDQKRNSKVSGRRADPTRRSNIGSSFHLDQSVSQTSKE